MFQNINNPPSSAQDPFTEFVEFDMAEGDGAPLELANAQKYRASEILKAAEGKDSDRKISTPGNPVERDDDPVDESVHAEARLAFEGNTRKAALTFEGTEFLVHIAESNEQKAAGLEILSALEDGKGMLFPFKPAQHVTFHMGSVKFPIDIVFLLESPLGDSLRVGKIAHNVQPGDLSRWACNDTAAVAEFPGGTCKALGIAVGSYLGVDK